MIKRILLGLGGTPYTPVAIERAVRLAQYHEAGITAVTVVRREQLVNTDNVQGEADEAMRRHVTEEKIEESIAVFESACQTAGLKFAIKVESGDPFDLFISMARYHDLMVFGLRSIFEYHLSREAPDVTLARLVSEGVRPLIAVSSEFRPINTALIAYSGSMESAKTMKRFVQLRLWPDVELKIVTFQHSDDKAHQLLYDASEYCRAHGFHVRRADSNPGSPKDFLLPIATYWQADIIVLGNSARNMLLKRILGETALHIIRHADRPLFLCQ